MSLRVKAPPPYLPRPCPFLVVPTTSSPGAFFTLYSSEGSSQSLCYFCSLPWNVLFTNSFMTSPPPYVFAQRSSSHLVLPTSPLFIRILQEADTKKGADVQGFYWGRYLWGELGKAEKIKSVPKEGERERRTLGWKCPRPHCLVGRGFCIIFQQNWNASFD